MSCCGGGSSFSTGGTAQPAQRQAQPAAAPVASPTGGVVTGGAQRSAANAPLPQTLPPKTSAAKPFKRTFV